MQVQPERRDHASHQDVEQAGVGARAQGAAKCATTAVEVEVTEPDQPHVPVVTVAGDRVGAGAVEDRIEHHRARRVTRLERPRLAHLQDDVGGRPSTARPPSTGRGAAIVTP